MAQTHDVIVLGIGGMGAAVARSLAIAGLRVLGLEQFGPHHDRGSSYGRTRVIRKAYFEDPRYVPMLHRTYELWREIESESGDSLLNICGCLNIGPTDHVCVQGAKRSAVEHGLRYEQLDAKEIRHRFPAFQPNERDIGIFEPEGGYIRVDLAQRAIIKLAKKAGAALHWDEPVKNWSMERTHVRVETDKGIYEAASMVVCAGAWLGELIPSLSKILKVERQPQLWFAPTDMTNFRPGAMPSFIHFVEDRAYFGIPSEGENFVKIGQHHGGAIMRASEIDRFISAEDEERVRSYIREFMPKADGPLAESHVCMYTNTPDDHFILDRHPEYANVYIAGGFSGHGYKFTPVVGEYMRNAVLAKPNEAAFELFRLGRFQ